MASACSDSEFFSNLSSFQSGWFLVSQISAVVPVVTMVVLSARSSSLFTLLPSGTRACTATRRLGLVNSTASLRSGVTVMLARIRSTLSLCRNGMRLAGSTATNSTLFSSPSSDLANWRPMSVSKPT
ncbi:hypothetical protein D9M71_695490 [compost metagenome]